MKLIKSVPGSAPDHEINTLIEVLHNSAQRLEELTGGEVDSVADREGRTYLLRHAQDQLRVHEAAKQSAILDALPAHAALLDATGLVVSVNEAWRLFDAGNSILSPGYPPNSNYLGILDTARGAEASDAHRVAEGIRSVLDGREMRFSIEYPCHSKTRDRWFLMTATPLVDDTGIRVAVMHLDITSQRRGEEALRRLGAALDVVDDAVYLVDRASMRFVHINDTACRMQGRARDEMMALGPEGILSIPRAELERTYDTLIASGTEAAPLELLRPRKGAPDAWVELRRHAVRSGDRWTIVTLVRDITELVVRREKLHRFRAAMDFSGDAILLVDRASMRYIDVNQTLCTMVGRSREEMLGMTPMDVFNADRETLERDYDALIANNADTANSIEGTYRHSDGSLIPIETRRRAMHTGQGWVIVASARDIRERKAAQHKLAKLARMRTVSSEIKSAIIRIQEPGQLYREACRIAVEYGGYRLVWIGLADRDAMKIVPVASAGADTGFLDVIKDHFSLREGSRQAENLSVRAITEKKAMVSNDIDADSSLPFENERIERGIRSFAALPLLVAEEAKGVMLLYADEADFFQEEELNVVIEIAGDLSFALDRLDKQARLDYLAYYDALTGLANRSLFLERVTQYMRVAAGSGHGLALFLVDLERFKNINDSLGQAAGDTLLRQVAEWLIRNTGDVGLLARIGADQFALVLPKIEADGDLVRLVERTLGAFVEHPFHLAGTELRISAKVGVALYPEDGEGADALLKSAEAALKKAKATGEKFLFYTQKMTARVAGALTLETKLRHALDRAEFVLHYQPKVNLESGKLTSAEALIRWNDPVGGLVPPGLFIPNLEATGLIYDVGRWALRRAIADCLRWRRAGLPAVRIAVNVSPLQLRNRGFVAEIEQAVGTDPHAAAGLELEITENLIMADVSLSIVSLQAIRMLGVTVAVDDFGTGFSSLAYLAKLPVDALKIDRSFIIEMTSGPQGLALVSTIINLAHSLKLKVIAEGVETDEQSRLLRLLGCDEMQGYLFSKAVPAEEFEKMLLNASGPVAAGTDSKQTG